ncbi:MAG: Bac luciferase protein [Dehalococcoidia bacterium]|nr:Bac luciferase protein [Dehalococcoidia bacterium]
MNENPVRLGILLPTRGLLLGENRPHDAELVLRMAARAEEGGLDDLWVGDSLTSKPRLEPLTTLAAVAARTRRVRLGTAVLLGALRHPVLLAHIAGTLDILSGGRLVLGMGVGGAFNEEQRQEWLAAGVKPSQRARRLEETVEILKRLWAEEQVSFHGRHFQLDGVHMEPRPLQEKGVPILLASHLRSGREEQLRRAARLGDGFISISETPEEYAQLAQRIRGYAREYGRDPDSLESAQYMTVNLNQDEARAKADADRFIRAYYGTNMWEELWGPFGPPSQTVERIHAYRRAGAGTIVVRFASFDPEGQLDTFLEEVWPAFRATP